MIPGRKVKPRYPSPESHATSGIKRNRRNIKN
jgi:hypothetical protein